MRPTCGQKNKKNKIRNMVMLKIYNSCLRSLWAILENLFYFYFIFCSLEIGFTKFIKALLFHAEFESVRETLEEAKKLQ